MLHNGRIRKTLALAGVSLMMLTSCVGLNNSVLGGVHKQNTKSSAKYAACVKTGGAKGTGNLGDQNHLKGASEQLSEDQNKVAQTIVSVGQNMGLDERAQAIAVATGLVESNLTNVDYGDDKDGVKNPDGTLTSSLGVFQQQKWWGSVEDRMNVSRSSELFYEALTKFDYSSMDEGAAAQKVQGSAYPYKYGERMQEAHAIVSAVSAERAEGSGGKKEEKKDKVSGSGTQVSSVTKRKADCSSSGSGKKASYVDSKGNNTYPLDFSPTDAEKSQWYSSKADPWGSFMGQCVSYVLWKLNEAHGATRDNPKVGTKADYGMSGDANAREWDNIDRNYATVDKRPEPGAIAQFEPGAMSGIGEYGHVAWVEEVDEEKGRVRVSQYNWTPLEYNEMWIDTSAVSNFIHVK